MKLSIHTLFLLSAIVIGGVACDDDDNSADMDASVGQMDGGLEFVCDPVGANPGVGGLLNAAPGSDVEVIVKEAQHPGNPGPLELP